MNDPRLNRFPGNHGTRIVGGTLQVFLAEGLMVPTGLLTVAYLTRVLGPEGYGLFTLTAAVVIWIELIISSVFSRASIKFVSEAVDWRPVGAAVVQFHFGLSCAAAALLFFLAKPLSGLFIEPIMANYFRLFALDIPLFSLANAHRNILTGVGGFRERAMAGAGRWVFRLALIVLLVELGFSVEGAILGSIGASIVELILCRFYIRPSLFKPAGFPAKGFIRYALPLSLFAFSMHFYNKLDLFMLKILGATTYDLGVYGAAQNLCILPGIFAISFSPLLLSTLGNLLGVGENQSAKKIALSSLRAIILALPLAGMTAGAAPEIVLFVFGPPYGPAATLTAFLIFSSLAWLMISVSTSILTAGGKPAWPFILTGPMVPAAFFGHWILIPKLGAVGAAIVTTGFALLGAVAVTAAVHKTWHVHIPFKTLARSILLSGGAFSLAVFWPTPGLFVLLKLAVICLSILAVSVLLGEISTSEMALIKAALRPGKGLEKSRDTIL